MFGRGYNLTLAGFWLVVLAFVLAREAVLPPAIAAKFGGPEGWVCGLVAAGLAIYNLARWWALRSAYTRRAVQVNPLAERLPDPDNPPPKWEPNPELDFTKPAEQSAADSAPQSGEPKK
jgi:hypothetical protein